MQRAKQERRSAGGFTLVELLVVVALIIIGRELVILGLRGEAAANGTIVEPSIWGKLKAAVQFLAILLALVRFSHQLGPLLLDQWVMVAAAVITVISGAEYLARFSSTLTPSKGPSPP